MEEMNGIFTCTQRLDSVVGKAVWTEETRLLILSLYFLYPSVDMNGNGMHLSPLYCCERDASDVALPVVLMQSGISLCLYNNPPLGE